MIVIISNTVAALISAAAAANAIVSDVAPTAAL
jgi:hypothetical protein